MLLWLTIVGTLSGSWSPETQWKTVTLQAERRLEADDLAVAEALRWRALKIAQMKLGLEDPRLVPLVAQWAGVLHLERRDAEAEPLVRSTLEVANKRGEAKWIGIALNALATVLAGEGERARAEPVFRRSLALLEESEGVDALDTANAANNLAALYCDIGEYPQAEKTMTVALAFYEKHRNSFQPLLAMGLRNMFVILFKERMPDRAEPYLMRALAIGEQLFPHSRRMAELGFAQGVLQASRGKFQDAAATLRQVIEVQEKTLGPEHPALAYSLISYSEVLRHLHRSSEAHAARQRGSSILKSLNLH